MKQGSGSVDLFIRRKGEGEYIGLRYQDFAAHLACLVIAPNDRAQGGGFFEINARKIFSGVLDATRTGSCVRMAKIGLRLLFPRGARRNSEVMPDLLCETWGKQRCVIIPLDQRCLFEIGLRRVDARHDCAILAVSAEAKL
jgi:hypothetical protein